MIPLSGTITSAVNLQMAQNKWMQKKSSGNVLSRQELNARENWTSDDWMKNNFLEQLAEEKEQQPLNDILNKVATGQDLTPDEIEYLQKKNPQAYENYKNSEKEEKNYKEKLDHAKTKDEVDKIKVEKVYEFLSKLNKVVNDPNISMGDKLAAAQDAMNKTNRINKADTEFRQSARYASLPTEAELQEERIEEREAREDAIQEKQDNHREAQEEAIQDAENNQGENSESQDQIRQGDATLDTPHDKDEYKEAQGEVSQDAQFDGSISRHRESSDIPQDELTTPDPHPHKKKPKANPRNDKPLEAWDVINYAKAIITELSPSLDMMKQK